MKKYEIEGRDIPLMIKELRIYRRTLKGEPKIAVTKSIDNLINAYSNHLDENINKIYWMNMDHSYMLTKYQSIRVK